MVGIKAITVYFLYVLENFLVFSPGKTLLRDFWPRWRHRKIHFASLHNQKKDNKKQPELLENGTVWKSNNQGVREETFIQTGRRGGEDTGQGGGVRTRVGKAVAAGLGCPTFACR